MDQILITMVMSFMLQFSINPSLRNTYWFLFFLDNSALLCEGVGAYDTGFISWV